LIISGKGYDGSNYALAPIGVDTNFSTMFLVKSGITIYGADERFVAALPPEIPCAVAEDRDSFDYLYRRDDLATLPGNRYHKKKNRINYFSSRHHHAVELFTADHHAGCHRLLTSLAGNDAPSHQMELAACHEAIEMAEPLGLSGIVITVEGDVQAFALGERLNRQTAICHFEKGNHFMDGIMQLVNREFSRLLFTGCSYINREQDLGVSGIRNAKLSYHPVELVKKFRLLPTPETIRAYSKIDCV
jgi:hypothetical protein